MSAARFAHVAPHTPLCRKHAFPRPRARTCLLFKEMRGFIVSQAKDFLIESKISLAPPVTYVTLSDVLLKGRSLLKGVTS